MVENICIECGWPLDGGDYMMPWEDGDNPYAIIRCPHCGCENPIYEDDDDE